MCIPSSSLHASDKQESNDVRTANSGLETKKAHQSTEANTEKSNLKERLSILDSENDKEFGVAKGTTPCDI